ncbi:hypothetical protein [Shewanella algae]|uniref:hypothetical protein n=1 Tax=Shewanella algae TaxID=38313 RepID=UPI001AACF09F|nr:hypothetical protein [Shewanella algae]QTE85420.1 hypothetical protein JKK44_15195 [Shewanella algae]
MNHTTDKPLETLIVETAELFNMPEPESTLLLEFTSNPGGDPNHGGSRANVATDYDDKVYLEGVFLSATSNSDIKFSSVEDMHRAVRDYQKQFVETGQALGELRGSSWVPKPTPDPEKAALRVVDLSIEGDSDVMGKAALISPKLRALVLAGWRPVIRVRALGRQDQSGVIKAGFKIVAFDVAWSSDNKSTLNAFGRAPATSKSKTSTTRLNEQQQEPVTPATPSKQRLISPELIAEKFEQKFEQKKLNENRMREWISSVRNNTDFK